MVRGHRTVPGSPVQLTAQKRLLTAVSPICTPNLQRQRFCIACVDRSSAALSSGAYKELPKL